MTVGDMKKILSGGNEAWDDLPLTVQVKQCNTIMQVPIEEILFGFNPMLPKEEQKENEVIIRIKIK